MCCFVCLQYKIATLTNAWRALPASLSAYTLSFALRCKCWRGRVIWDVLDDDLPGSVAVSSSTMTNDDAAVAVLPLLAALPPPLLDRRVRIKLYYILLLSFSYGTVHSSSTTSVYHAPRSRCTIIIALKKKRATFKNANVFSTLICSPAVHKYLSVHR